MEELKKLIEALGRAFEEFKALNDTRIKAIETKGHADPLLEEKVRKVAEDLARIEGQVQAKTQQLEAIERAVALAAAPGGGGGKPKPIYSSLGEQLVDVYRAANPDVSSGGRADAIGRLSQVRAAATGASEAVPSDGGYLVQQDFAGMLSQSAIDTGILSARCFRVPISANANGLKANLMAETSRATGSRYGGIQAYWLAEAGTLTKSKPTYRQIELNLKKLIGLFYATEELLQDATAMTALVNRWFPMEFGFKIDDAIIRGTGAGMPLGILNAGSLVSVAKETGQAAATVVAENVIKMFSRLVDSSDAGSEWYCNRDILPQLYTMSVAVGTGGIPIWLPANGAADRPFQMLLGKPLRFIEQCETLGTVGDILLADLGQYILIEKGGIQAAVSVHVQFLTDEQTFRWTYRIDGQPIPNAVLTPYKGTANTRSPFIALATRA